VKLFALHQRMLFEILEKLLQKVKQEVAFLLPFMVMLKAWLTLKVEQLLIRLFHKVLGFTEKLAKMPAIPAKLKNIV
jgi:hypothetical protein